MVNRYYGRSVSWPNGQKVFGGHCPFRRLAIERFIEVYADLSAVLMEHDEPPCMPSMEEMQVLWDAIVILKPYKVQKENRFIFESNVDCAFLCNYRYNA